jgi:hypothetical protein
VTSIGKVAFKGCCGLTEVVVPDGVTELGDGAFEDCSGLRRLTIPSRFAGNARVLEDVTAVAEVHFSDSEVEPAAAAEAGGS